MRALANPLPLAMEPSITLTDYLEALDAELEGMIPDSDRERLVEEAGDHLEFIVEQFMDNDLSRIQAEKRALDSFGSPRTVADEFIDACWRKRSTTNTLVRRMGMANAYAFGIFGIASFAYWVLIQLRVFLPYGGTLPIEMSPAEIRRYIPEPLPYPEASLSYLIILLYPLVAPFVAGWLCGRVIPIRAGVAVYRSLLPITLSSYALGTLLLPATEGLLFAFLQTVFWIPVGYLMANLSSSMRRRTRNTRRRHEL